MVAVGQDEDAVLGAIDEFLGEEVGATEALPAGLLTVLFTDLVGHTEMMSRLGDDAAATSSASTSASPARC